MQSQTTFYTSTMDSETGEIRQRRIDVSRTLYPDDLRIDVRFKDGVRHVDPLNADPTLTQFHEPRRTDEGKRNGE